MIAVAQPRDEVLGVLALLDPGRQAGEHDLFALEQGAVVLTIELVHLRSLAETELRLRRDLMDDLLTGTDDESALTRSQALGHDLRAPHQVVIVRWHGAQSDNALVRAIDHAMTSILTSSALLARRPGGVVLVATREGHDDQHRWGELHRRLTMSLRSRSGAIGVGGVCNAPSEVPRSYAEAKRALRVRMGSSSPSGVMVYDDLGIYRLFALGEDDHDVKRFVREWLGPLLDYDATSQSDLVGTLWQYFECGRQLRLHRRCAAHPPQHPPLPAAAHPRAQRPRPWRRRQQAEPARRHPGLADTARGAVTTAISPSRGRVTDPPCTARPTNSGPPL